MKREIKFRAWHEQKKVIFSAEEMGLDQLTILTDGRGFINVHGGNTELSILHPEMIPMQFTGLYDKDGKEIYEGDVIGRKDGLKRFVVYEGSMFIARVIGDAEHISDDAVEYLQLKMYEVIGNIYQNPELLSKA